MATYTKQKLSNSTNGKQILITATTNGAAQLIHTAVAGTSSFDEVWLYVYNDSANIVNLIFLWGGTTEPDNKFLIPVPSQAGRICVVDGMLLQNGLLIKAYAAVGSVIVIDGFVNNIA